MGAQEKVVYIDGEWSAAAIEGETLRARGYDLVLAGCKNDDEVAEVAGDATAIMNGIYYMGAELFARLPELKVVVRAGVGYDNLDVDAATKAGIIICNVVNYGTNEVANHAFALLLALNRKLVPLDRAIRAGAYAPPSQSMPHTGRLAGETLGLVSFGAIARAVARRATGFDMSVVAYDPYVDAADAAALGVELLDLPEVLSRSDYVSVHAPLTPATRGLVGRPEFALMKPSAYLVVTSRGGVVDEDALTTALRDRTIAGAGLDVWAQEPPATDLPLLGLDNVVGTMHWAWYSEVADVARRTWHAETVADVLDGFMPRSVVNPEVLERVPLRPRPGQ